MIEVEYEEFEIPAFGSCNQCGKGLEIRKKESGVDEQGVSFVSMEAFCINCHQ